MHYSPKRSSHQGAIEQLTRSPFAWQNLARHTIRQRDSRKAKPDQDLGDNQAVDVVRTGRDSSADERDKREPDKERFPRLEGVGGGRDDGRNNGLHERKRVRHPGLGGGVAKICADVREL